jgi:hypothetical protein
MRLGLPWLLGRPAAPPLKWGLVVAASLIMAETLVLYPLKRIAFENTLGVVYLLGVVVVAIVWGFWLAAATSVASVLAFDYFHIPPVFAFSPHISQKRASARRSLPHDPHRSVLSRVGLTIRRSPAPLMSS